MQSPAQHSTPTTTDALSVSPASSGRTPDTAVPPLSISGNVTSPAPTTIQQQAAFLNSAHGPATCNAGGVSATLSLIATQTPEPESRNAALAWQSTTPAALPTLSASGLPIGNSESVDKRVSTSVVPSIAKVLPSITSADNLSTEMDFTASQMNEDNTPSPEGSWNTVSANRKPASTARPRSELITVGIQLPPGTLTPKLPLYDLLSTITAAANLSPKTSAEVTLQAKPAQSLVFLKTHSPLTSHLLLSLTSLELNESRHGRWTGAGARFALTTYHGLGIGEVYAERSKLLQTRDVELGEDQIDTSIPLIVVGSFCRATNKHVIDEPFSSSFTDVNIEVSRDYWPRRHTVAPPT
ncbi:hypothetical protein HPB51_006534 [Rhipicephalus microplus]|uniref:Uncharacterized protein n=1 Tax=Rhipicephalus microplus TaxID=6941 RepID=A0A9J6E701_RHIMP|nr:hypothetical protein HPB51_006534 [Rhipicephalus microplus]